MLVLGRKEGESVRIGDNIIVTVLRVGSKVRLGIEAPRETSVLREEVNLRDKDENRQDPAA